MDYTIEIVGKETRNLHRQLFGVVTKAVRIALTVAMALMAFSYLVLALESGQSSDIAAVVGYLAGVVVSITLPSWMGSLTYRKKLKYYNGTMPDTTVRFGAEIRISDVDSNHTIQYDKIKKLIVTEDGIVLWLMDSRAIAIPKSTFTLGSLQEMLALLREKCPQLKLPDWQ